MNLRKFDLNIEKILEDWEVHHAIREIISNAIDEELLTGSKQTQIFIDDDSLWHIRDFGRGLQYEHLTQKEDEEKLNNPHVIGKFGIGLKDALATFDRKGIEVSIKSKYGEISLGKSEKSDFEDIITLHAYIKPSLDPNFVGTDVILKGCTKKDIKKAQNLFLRFSGENKLDATKYGEVFQKKDKSSRIYVNGVRVAEEDNFLFSYNITSLNKSIRKSLNRERTNVGRTAYTGRVKSILLSCKSETVAKILVEDLKRFQTGNLHDELNWTDVSVHACKILNSYEKVVFITPDQLMVAGDMVNRAITDGYKIIPIPENIRNKISGLTDINGNKIRDLNQYHYEWDQSFSFNFVNKEDMTQSERKIFNLTNSILNLIGGKPLKVKEILISSTMRLVGNSYSETVGIWEGESGRIIIKRTQLGDLETYAGTLLHETVHAISGASDLSSTFEQYLSNIIGRITAKIIKIR